MKMKKVGIITFHNSYNCGSMLETYALQQYLKIKKINNEIIDFSNEGQINMYSVFEKNVNIRKVIKNFITLFHYKKIEKNNKAYQEFQNKFFELSPDKYKYMNQLNDKRYNIVISGSDQIWNITIPDADDAYFLPWVKDSKRIAYAPSFGAKDLRKNTNNIGKYIEYLNQYDALSIREFNGQKWLKEMLNKDVEVLIDPTLLLTADHYNQIIERDYKVPDKYIFFYCPSFNKKICRLVKKISKKYKLPVITWSAKRYYLAGIGKYGFELPKYENPSVYLQLIKNATLNITTSFHGTIFSTIYKTKFFTIKNGGMYGDDDRVKTLLKQLKLEDRLIVDSFNDSFDYTKEVDYSDYNDELPKLQKKAENYLERNIQGERIETSK